jgi:hypothetical protein
VIPVLTGDGVMPAAGPNCYAISLTQPQRSSRPDCLARRTARRPGLVLVVAASVDAPDVKRRSWAVRVPCPAEGCGAVHHHRLRAAPTRGFTRTGACGKRYFVVVLDEVGA